MESENFITPNDSHEEDFSDSKFQNFKKLAHDYFDRLRTTESDIIGFVKENAKLYSFSLPPYLVDVLILYDEAPYYWLTDSPFVLSIEEFFKRHYSKIYDPDNIKSIKANYTKWAIQNDTESKSYFAKSALSLLEKNPQKNNFIFSLYQGTILTFDPMNSNAEKAAEIYSKAYDTVSSLDLKQHLKDEAFYLISIFHAFTFLKQGDLYSATEEFHQALTKRETGVSAKYYLAYLSSVQGDEESAKKYLQEIFLNDISKVQYAISVNSVNLLSYFLTNSASLSFFNERAFVGFTQFLHELFKGVKKTEPEFIDALNNKLHILHELHYEEYYDKEINDIVPFIGKTYQVFKGSKNIFLLANSDKLVAKFDRIHEIIFNAISKKLYNQLKESLRPYDQQIAENAEKITLLNNEMEAFVKATKEEYETESKVIEENAANSIKELEVHLDSVELDKKFDPQVAFTNSMFYNLIVSFAVFILVGLASYSNTNGSDSSSFRGFFSALMIGGTKWGAVTFLVGLLVSVFAAASVVMEKANYKQKMQNKINYLKQRREKDLEVLKQNNTMRIRMIEQNYNNKIDSAKKADEEFNAERGREEQKQREKIEADLKEEEQKLSQLI